jgi:hypothetical protein
MLVTIKLGGFPDAYPLVALTLGVYTAIISFLAVPLIGLPINAFLISKRMTSWKSYLWAGLAPSLILIIALPLVLFGRRPIEALFQFWPIFVDVFISGPIAGLVFWSVARPDKFSRDQV